MLSDAATKANRVVTFKSLFIYSPYSQIEVRSFFTGLAKGISLQVDSLFRPPTIQTRPLPGNAEKMRKRVHFLVIRPDEGCSSTSRDIQVFQNNAQNPC